MVDVADLQQNSFKPDRPKFLYSRTVSKFPRKLDLKLCGMKAQPEPSSCFFLSQSSEPEYLATEKSELLFINLNLRTNLAYNLYPGNSSLSGFG